MYDHHHRVFLVFLTHCQFEYLDFYFFNVYECSVCIDACRERKEGTRSHYRWLWPTMYLLGIELRTSGRTTNALNCWAVSLAPWIPWLLSFNFHSVYATLDCYLCFQSVSPSFLVGLKMKTLLILHHPFPFLLLATLPKAHQSSPQARFALHSSVC